MWQSDSSPIRVRVDKDRLMDDETFHGYLRELRDGVLSRIVPSASVVADSAAAALSGLVRGTTSPFVADVAEASEPAQVALLEQAVWLSQLGCCAAVDHLRSTICLAETRVDGSEPGAVGALVTARAALESAAIPLWLLDDDASPRLRMCRTLAYWWSSANWGKKILDHIDSATVEAPHAVADHAAAANIERSGNRFGGEDNVNLTAAVEAILERFDDPQLAPTYAVLSMVAHTRPGLSLLFSADDQADLFASPLTPDPERYLPVVEGALHVATVAVRLVVSQLLGYLGTTSPSLRTLEAAHDAFVQRRTPSDEQSGP
jgi:hypothetical protein